MGRLYYEIACLDAFLRGCVIDRTKKNGLRGAVIAELLGSDPSEGEVSQQGSLSRPKVFNILDSKITSATGLEPEESWVTLHTTASSEYLVTQVANAYLELIGAEQFQKEVNAPDPKDYTPPSQVSYQDILERLLKFRNGKLSAVAKDITLISSLQNIARQRVWLEVFKEGTLLESYHSASIAEVAYLRSVIVTSFIEFLRKQFATAAELLNLSDSESRVSSFIPDLSAAAERAVSLGVGFYVDEGLHRQGRVERQLLGVESGRMQMAVLSRRLRSVGCPFSTGPEGQPSRVEMGVQVAVLKLDGEQIVISPIHSCPNFLASGEVPTKTQMDLRKEVQGYLESLKSEVGGLST
ncbi:MAG: hypothetical protein ACOCXP_00185 [Candidatus Dojkabacteria bacterium]